MLIWIVRRAFEHRERMAMIAHGLVPPGGFGRATRVGPPFGDPTDRESATGTLIHGIKMIFVGMALLIGLSFIGYHSGGPLGVGTVHPGPWLLGGLIPMFIGVAKVFIAVLSGATLRPMVPPGPTAPSGGPFTHRPGGEYQELDPPTRPPQRQ